MRNRPRLHFIDALRAFAILMMLQGHFISGVLNPDTIDPTNVFYTFWLYCRGFTAPVFFTITGWVFTFLLLQNEEEGWKNPRIKKGLKRSLELLLWGYLLRLNLPMLFNGQLNSSFLYPDVLQIIGLGLIFIILIYLLFSFMKQWTNLVFLGIGLLIFICEPLYVDLNFPKLPSYLSAYLTKANKGVFYLFPWLGYVSLGAFIAYLFPAKTNHLWSWTVGFIALGLWLIFRSSAFLIWLESVTNIELFRQLAYNNFLFIRLGDVFVLFGIFMFFNNNFKRGLWTTIGGKTLEIYIVHYFIFYGSLFGIGVYKYAKYSWAFGESVIGALVFMGGCVGIVLLDKHYREKIFTFLKRKIYQ